MTYAVPKPWGKAADGPSFLLQDAVEFKESSIADAGLGFWAKVDIPANTHLRTVSVTDGTLLRFNSEEDLRATGWEMEDLVNYGIGHRGNVNVIYFLNPGTAMNHADPSRREALTYKHDVEDEYQLWTTRDVKAGEEIFCNYTKCFPPVKWYDELMNRNNLTPLSQLGAIIDEAAKQAD